MTKGYEKPQIVFVDFTLNQTIASSTCNTSWRDFGDGQNMSDGSSCWIEDPDFGDKIFTVGVNNNCDTTSYTYCYYTSSITIFAS